RSNLDDADDGGDEYELDDQRKDRLHSVNSHARRRRVGDGRTIQRFQNVRTGEPSKGGPSARSRWGSRMPAVRRSVDRQRGVEKYGTAKSRIGCRRPLHRQVGVVDGAIDRLLEIFLP